MWGPAAWLGGWVGCAGKPSMRRASVQVLVNERCVKALALVNSGLLKFDFVWKVGNRAHHEHTPF